MKRESLNHSLQRLLFPGIGIVGLLISLLCGTITSIPIFYGISVFLRAIFSFCKDIYGNGIYGNWHWYSKKERILDGISFIFIGIIGEVGIILYIV